MNIVLTRDSSWQATGVTVVHDMAGAMAAAGTTPELMVAGGGEIYALLLPLANRLLITHVDGDGHAAVFFPAILPEVWEVKQKTTLPTKAMAAEVWEYVRR